MRAPSTADAPALLTVKGLRKFFPVTEGILARRALTRPEGDIPSAARAMIRMVRSLHNRLLGVVLVDQATKTQGTLKT